jgi:hypothetical protein
MTPRGYAFCAELRRGLMARDSRPTFRVPTYLLYDASDEESDMGLFVKNPNGSKGTLDRDGIGNGGHDDEDDQDSFEKSDEYKTARDAWTKRRARDQGGPPAFSGRPTPGGEPLPLTAKDASALHALTNRLAMDSAAALVRARDALAKNARSAPDARKFAKRFPGASRIKLLG